MFQTTKRFVAVVMGQLQAVVLSTHPQAERTRVDESGYGSQLTTTQTEWHQNPLGTSLILWTDTISRLLVWEWGHAPMMRI